MGFKVVKGRAETAPGIGYVTKADTWESRGEGGLWKRTHGKPRKRLFTPSKIPQGPRPEEINRMTTRRVTRGCFVEGGHFVLEDNWHEEAQAHMLMDKAWTGTTTFTIEKAEPARRPVNGLTKGYTYF